MPANITSVIGFTIVSRKVGRNALRGRPRRGGRLPRLSEREAASSAETDEQQRAADCDRLLVRRDERQDERADENARERVEEVRERRAERRQTRRPRSPAGPPVPKISSAIGPIAPATTTPKTNAFHIAASPRRSSARLSRRAREADAEHGPVRDQHEPARDEHAEAPQHLVRSSRGSTLCRTAQRDVRPAERDEQRARLPAANAMAVPA